MAYIDGKPLSELIGVDQPLPIATAVSLVQKLAIALEYAHGEGVIHRDLKPANIMIDREWQPLIMDFGLAREIDKEDQTRLTQDGMILGTPAYMSPEQAEGNLAAGKQSDVYSLGVILYELLTGKLPFEGTVAAVIGQIMTRDAPPPSAARCEVDAELDGICQKMMARKAENRYLSMREVADALAGYLEGRASGAREPAGTQVHEDAPASQAADEGLAAFASTAAEPALPAASPPRDGTPGQSFAPRIKPPSRAKAVAASALGALLLLLTVVFMFTTRYGTVRVEVVGDKDVEVLIDDKSIRLTDGKWSDERTGGEHRLGLKIGGQQLLFDEKSKRFNLADGSLSVKIAGARISGGKFEVLRGEGVAITLEVIRPSDTDVADKPTAGVTNAPSRPLAGDTSLKLVSQFEHGATNTKRCYFAALSPDGTHVAYRMAYDSPTRMFETASKQQRNLPKEMQYAMELDYNADGSLFATGHLDGTVRVWNSRTLEPVGPPFLTTAETWVRWVSLSDDGSRLLALTRRQPPTFYAWDVATREKLTEPFPLIVDLKAKGIHLAASSDALLLAAAYYEKGLNHLVQLWDIKTGRPCERQFVPTVGGLGTIYGVDLSPRGDRLAVASKNESCFVFDTATGKQLMTAPHAGRVVAARFSPDGRRLVTCGGPPDSEDMHLWDVVTGEELVRWSLPVDDESFRTERFGAWATFLTFSSDGSRLLTAGVNTPICVWKVEYAELGE